MKKKFTLLLLFLIGAISAQTRGVIKDSLTGKPVPFVSIWSENENIGTTSEENGSFEIATTEKSKTLIFNSLGFEKKKLALSKTVVVLLSPKVNELKEVVVRKRKETKRREIGIIESTVLEAFENQPKIDLKFFRYQSDYKQTGFIKKIGLITDSRIDDATIKIHLYSVDANGFPGAELLDRDLVVTVGKGNRQSMFDVSKFNLVFPKTGIFIGFEKIMIEKNKREDRNTYYPYVLYNWVARNPSFVFLGGQWSQQSAEKKNIYEPAITLVLTN
jgi:CarboxypepD_reg-like domain